MEHWYVLRTAEKKEQDAAELLNRVVDRALWSECRILRKLKVFRSGGALHLLEEVLFPGYVFIRTGRPKELAGELQKSREFPQFLTGEEPFAALAPEDLAFLQEVCGENLQRPMGVTRIVLDKNNCITRAEGVLSPYLDRIIKLNLRKRFAIVEVPLFNRSQPVLFGLRLPQDQAG